MTRAFLLVIIASIALSACRRHSAPQPVPRRTAYPRVEVMPRDYAVPDSLPLPFGVNTSAAAKVGHRPDGSVWLTIDYEPYGATAYLTFTPVTDATVTEVANNRLHRMALNLGACAAQSYAFETTSGMSATVLQSSTAPGAAVQAIAVSPRWVVSGSTVFPPAAADSIAPLVQAVADDIITALKAL